MLSFGLVFVMAVQIVALLGYFPISYFLGKKLGELWYLTSLLTIFQLYHGCLVLLVE